MSHEGARISHSFIYLPYVSFYKGFLPGPSSFHRPLSPLARLHLMRVHGLHGVRLLHRPRRLHQPLKGLPYASGNFAFVF